MFTLDEIMKQIYAFSESGAGCSFECISDTQSEGEFLEQKTVSADPL